VAHGNRYAEWLRVFVALHGSNLQSGTWRDVAQKTEEAPVYAMSISGIASP
jgi:hypothetical protein